MTFSQTASALTLAFVTAVTSTGCTVTPRRNINSAELTPAERNRPVAAAAGAGVGLLLLRNASNPALLGAALIGGGLGYLAADQLSPPCSATLATKENADRTFQDVVNDKGVIVGQLVTSSKGADSKERKTFCRVDGTRTDMGKPLFIAPPAAQPGETRTLVPISTPRP